MFPRRKRNLNVPGVAEQLQPKESVYGINWERRKIGKDVKEVQNNEDVEDDKSIEQGEDSHERCVPKGQSELVLSERPNMRNLDFGQGNIFSAGLQKRPDFYEQNKKLTVYVDRCIVETMERLKKERYISSYSWLVAEAIKHYLEDRK